MLKEIVSLAIILGFVMNIVYVDHPNTTSYTIAFVLSLVILSPLVLWMKWTAVMEYRRSHWSVQSHDEESVAMLGILESSACDSVSQSEEVVGKILELHGDLEAGSVVDVEKQPVAETSDVN